MNDHITYLTDIGLFDIKGRINSNTTSDITKMVPINKYLLNNTPFLPLTASVSERVYCLKNEITQIPKCLNCTASVKFSINKYNTYCSFKCARGAPTVREKIKKTNIERYGVDNPTKSFKVRDQVKTTNIERYGVDNPFKSIDVQKKIKATNTERHGAPHALQSNTLLQKAKSTNIERYGVDNVMSSPVIQQKAKDTNIERYGVDNPFKSTDIQKKIKTTNITRYGVDNPFKSIDIQKKIKSTNMERYGVENVNQRRWVDTTVSEKLQSVDYWLYEHHQLKRSLVEIATELNISPITAHKYIKQQQVEIKSYSGSLGQTQIFQFIKSIYSGNIINNAKILGRQEIDIYLPDINIGFEYNGIYWHSELNGRDISYHINKWHLCNTKDINLIQIWSTEWENCQDIIKTKIKSSIGVPDEWVDSIDCKIIETSNTDCIHVSLTYNDIVISVATFNAHILIDYVECENVFVNSGLAKSIHYYKHKYNISHISHQLDLKWVNYNILSELNMVIVGYIPPKCFYFKHNEWNIPIQKNKFIDGLSEWENMQRLGYNRIWNCGYLSIIIS